jgi:hypothetical protein
MTIPKTAAIDRVHTAFGEDDVRFLAAAGGSSDIS